METKCHGRVGRTLEAFEAQVHCVCQTGQWFNDSGHVRPSLRVFSSTFCGHWKAEVFAGFSMAWSCSSDIDNTGDADSANCPALDFLQGMRLGAQSACSNFCWGHASYHHAVRASPEGQVCLQLCESRQACTSMRARQWNGTSKLAGCGKKIRLSYREEVKFQSAHTKSFDSCSICSVTWSGCDILFFKNSSCSCADEILSSMATRTVLSCVKNFYSNFFEALVLWCLTHLRSLPPSLSLCAMSKCVCEPHV